MSDVAEEEGAATPHDISAVAQAPVEEGIPSDVASPPPLPQPQSVRVGPTFPKPTPNVKPSKAACQALALVLRPHGAEHLADLLAEGGWSIESLGGFVEADLGKMRITGKSARAGVLAAAAAMKAEASLSPAEQLNRRRAREAQFKAFGQRQKGPREGRAAGVVPKASRATMVEGLDGPAGDSDEEERRPAKEYTATLPTANEHARQATIFLEHQRLDRAWPNAHSKLSQALNLSNAAPADYGPLYTIDIKGKATAINPPHKHNQGFQAKFCPCCADFVAESLAGKWQYLTEQKVVLGVGESETMTVWKDFKDSESVSIEYSKKRMNPSIKVRKINLNFERMMWGDRPVRRVNAKSVPFPSLLKKDIVHAPLNESDAANAALELAIFDLNRALISDTEETKDRVRIKQEEDAAILEVLTDIAILMEQVHHNQRLDLEEEERVARARIEGHMYESALDKLYAFEEMSVRQVEVRRWENQSAVILVKQCAFLEEMELNKRLVVMDEEAAARANLNKLLAMYNNQVHHVLAARKAQFLKSSRKARRGEEGSLAGRRCPVCRKTNCTFFHNPWKGRWKERGGALDLQPPIFDTFGDLNTLVNQANAHEYEEDEKTRKAMKEERKAKRRLMGLIGGSSPDRSTSPPLVTGSVDPNTMTPSRYLKDYVAAALFPSAAGNTPESIHREQDTPGSSFAAKKRMSVSDVPPPDSAEIGASAPPRPATAGSSRRHQQVLQDSSSMARPQSSCSRSSVWTPQRAVPFLPTGGGNPTVTPFSVSRNTKRTFSVSSKR